MVSNHIFTFWQTQTIFCLLAFYIILNCDHGSAPPPLIFYLIRWWISRVILCDSVNSFQRGPIMERADIVFHPWWFSRRISDERSQEIILELEYYHWGKKIFDKNVGGKWAVFQPKGVDGKKGCRTALPELIMFSLNKSCSFIDSYFQPVFVSIN